TTRSCPRCAGASEAGMDDVVALWLRVPRREIAYVKFVFESYEGVAVCRTIDPAEAGGGVIAVPDFAGQARCGVGALPPAGAGRRGRLHSHSAAGAGRDRLARARRLRAVCNPMTPAASGSLPTPPEGPIEAVSAAADVVFDWSYQLQRSGLVNLYEKAKTLQ